MIAYQSWRGTTQAALAAGRFAELYRARAHARSHEVVEVVHKAGLSAKVARMRPIGVIKG